MPLTFFLARQPIVDENRNVVMYEVFLRSKESPDKFPETIPPYKAAFIIIDLIASIGYKKIAGNKKIMVNFSLQNVINRHFLEVLNPKKTVLNLIKPYTELSAQQWSFIKQALKKLKQDGFEFAFDIGLLDHKEIKHLALTFADYIVVPVSGLERAKHPFLIKKRCIATQVETEEQFIRAKQAGCDLFEGYLFGKPEPIYTDLNLATLTGTIVKILTLIEQGADLKELEDAVKADPALVTKILKLINSAYYYLPVEISSIRQALALLGINNLRKYLAVLLVLDASKTLNIPLNEYRKMLLAALIAEKLAKYLKVDSDIAFLGGLFYCSDLVFQMPPEQVVVDLKLSHRILEGYIGDDETLHCIFSLAKEVAFGTVIDGTAAAECLKKLNIKEETLQTLVAEAEDELDRLLA